MCMCECMKVPTKARRGYWIGDKVIVSCQTWVLGNKYYCSGRTARTLNHQAFLQPLLTGINKRNLSSHP